MIQFYKQHSSRLVYERAFAGSRPVHESIDQSIDRSMGSKQQQQQQQQQHQQQQQQTSQLYPSRLGGGGGDYHHQNYQHHHQQQLASAASFSSAGANRKWVLNAKNDVVEVADHHHHGYSGGHFLMASGAANLSTAAAAGPQGFAGAGGECGRGSTSTATTGSVLTRYNSAPSCLFSDLDQIARSLNEVAATTATNAGATTSAANPPLFDLPPLPSSAMAMSLDKRTTSPDILKKKIGSGGGGGGGGSPSYSAQSSTSLAMDFGVVDHRHQHQNGFTGLLTASSTITSTSGGVGKNTTAAPPAMSMAAANLTRQGSSSASLLSRLEIDRVTAAAAQQQQHHGSSEEDSLDGMDQEVMVPGGSGAMDLGTVSSVDCGGFWDASSAAAMAVHPGAQLHGSVFLGNGNSSCSDQSGRKRIRDVDMDVLDVALDHSCSSGGGGGGGGGGGSHQQQHTLTRHLSLPISTSRSSGGLLAAENLLQDSVPCRLRAKRGCATHPRSIAERVRRTRISERMRRLQELVPNMDKQTNTSDMLDEAVEYMKFLQKQVDDLQDCREKCQGLCRMSSQHKTGSSGSQ